MAIVPAPLETIAVRKRFGDEWTDVRDFVRPRDYMVRQVVSQKPDWTIEELWQWVINNIRYPAGSFSHMDDHRFYAYHPNIPLIGRFFPLYGYSTRDYWEFPAEVLRDRMADCEGSAVTLVSMLRSVWRDLPAYVTVGEFRGFNGSFGHVWVSLVDKGQWLILDTTLRQLPARVPVENEGTPYVPYFRFNEQEVVIETEEVVIPENVRSTPGKDEAIGAWWSWLRPVGGV